MKPQQGNRTGFLYYYQIYQGGDQYEKLPHD